MSAALTAFFAMKFLRPAALLALAPLAVAASAQVAVSSTLDLAVSAEADLADGTVATDSVTRAQGAALDELVGSLFVSDPDAANGSSAASTYADALWVDAGQGSLAFTAAWNAFTDAEFRMGLNGFLTSKPVWIYTFQATEDGTFDLAYDVVPSGSSAFGLLGIALEWSGPGGGLDLRDVVDPSASGAFSRPLVAGQTYTIGVVSDSSIGGSSSVPFNGSFDATLNWQVNPVPEPASFCALGLGALATVRRRAARK